MKVVVGETERAVETLAGQTARVSEPDRSRRRALFGDVPQQRDLLRLLGIGAVFDVRLDLREETHRVQALVVVLDRVGVQHHARLHAQLATNHLVLGAYVAGDFDDGDAGDVDVVFNVDRVGFLVDRRRIDAALEVADLEMPLVFVELLERFEVGVADVVRVLHAGLERHHREQQLRRKQRIAADQDVLDRQAFEDRERHGAGRRIEVDVFDVRRDLAAVADALVVIVDLEHVLTERVRVEDLSDRKIHQCQKRVARHLGVAGEGDLRDDRVLDDAVGNRNAVRPRAHQRRRDVGEVSKRVDAR